MQQSIPIAHQHEHRPQPLSLLEWRDRLAQADHDTREGRITAMRATWNIKAGLARMPLNDLVRCRDCDTLAPMAEAEIERRNRRRL